MRSARRSRCERWSGDANTGERSNTLFVNGLRCQALSTRTCQDPSCVRPLAIPPVSPSISASYRTAPSAFSRTRPH